MTLETVLRRLETSRNGDRPAALRGLGDFLAGLDAAGYDAVSAEASARSGLDKIALDALRANSQKRRTDDEARRAQAAVEAAEAGDVDDGAAYAVQTGLGGTPFLVWRKRTQDGVTPVVLAHFVPRMTGEVMRHKSSGEAVRVMTVEIATARGPRTMEVLSEDMSDARRFLTCCYGALGGDLVLASTTASKHLPLAVTALADPKRERSEVYEYVGWQEHGGRLAYLATAGAIGTGDALTVDLAGLAAGAGVPALATFGPRDDGDDALAAALAALAGPVRHSYPDLVTLPGLAAVFLAPLLRFSPTVDRPGLHYVGTTGTRKTALLGVLQAFYGLPEPALSWRGTANSIEIALSSLRDALVTVDDLKAGTSDRGAAVKILQSYADRRGRSRATRTGGLATARFVGGLLVSAGEDIPSGEASVAARSLFIPIGATDARLDVLSDAQALAPTLPTLTARYLAWLIGKQDTVTRDMAGTFAAARDRYRLLLSTRKGLNDAGRVATSCALLETGATIGCQWLQAAGWTAAAAAEWLDATRTALETLAFTQAEAIGEESAALAFLRGLRALLDSRRAELTTVAPGSSLPDLAGCAPSAPAAVMIGWRVGDVFYLQPELMLSEVKQWQNRQGQRVEVTKRGLYAQLRDGGWLAEVDPEGKTEVKKRVGGRPQRVLALREAALDDG